MMVIFVSELMGTMVMLALGCGVVGNVLLERSKGQNSGWIVISAGWAVAVLCGVLVAQGLGGPAWLNPAVALAARLARPGPGLAATLAGIAGEFAGAFLGAVLAYLIYLPHWRLTPDPGLKLAVFATGPAIRSYGANCLTEALSTFLLMFILCAMSASRFAGGLGALTVGALIWGLGLSIGGSTGYALNPARDLGPRLAHALLPIPGKGPSDWSYAWVPVVGPILGALAGSGTWMLVARMGR